MFYAHFFHVDQPSFVSVIINTAKDCEALGRTQEGQEIFSEEDTEYLETMCIRKALFGSPTPRVLDPDSEKLWVVVLGLLATAEGREALAFILAKTYAIGRASASPST